jgi:hypothetical protein
VIRDKQTGERFDLNLVSAFKFLQFIFLKVSAWATFLELGCSLKKIAKIKAFFSE